MGPERRLGLAAAFARSLLAWCVDGTPRPLSATWAVTNRCNLRCEYCNTPFLDPSELPLSDASVLLDRLASSGVRRLGLAGGEPMVRKDVGEIVAMARARGLYVTMNTNLTLYRRRSGCVRGVDLFFTSLDGDRAHHEAVRGAGAHDGVLDAIRDIVAGGRPVVAICVVTEHSLDPADHLLAVAREDGFRVHFQPRCTGTEIVRGAASGALTDAALRAFFAGLLARKRAGAPVASSTAYLRALASWDDFRRSAVYDPRVRCAAGWGFFYVDPHGHAWPCAYTKGKTTPVDMLGDAWRDALGQPTPCTRCSVGPYLEFNLLFQQPLRAALSLAGSYA
jgi:MoaA/NifB/PqqE/SkfB family radical SAM enzyme